MYLDFFWTQTLSVLLLCGIAVVLMLFVFVFLFNCIFNLYFSAEFKQKNHYFHTMLSVLLKLIQYEEL